MKTKMKATGIKTSLPVTDKNCFTDFETDIPSPGEKDLLVKIDAIAVNPVDYKIRQNSAKDTVLEHPKILGWDAVGTVVSTGNSTTLFRTGDKVFYAGDITRPGCNAEYQLIDERIAGRVPEKSGTAETAAMPLTSLTAWEILFDRIRISPEKDKGKSILIIGGAGGVGSVAIQLAKKIAELTVIATASRKESTDWCKSLGADHVVNHRNLTEEMESIGFGQVDFILDLVDTNSYWDLMAELIKPQGHIASITGSADPVVLNKLKTKSASFSWEFMYTRSMFQTEDMIEQHHILNRIADLMDKNIIRSTLNHTLHGLSAENLRKAHEMLESGSTIGKIVITF